MVRVSRGLKGFPWGYASVQGHLGREPQQFSSSWIKDAYRHCSAESKVRNVQDEEKCWGHETSGLPEKWRTSRKKCCLHQEAARALLCVDQISGELWRMCESYSVCQYLWVCLWTRGHLPSDGADESIWIGIAYGPCSRSVERWIKPLCFILSLKYQT